MRFLTTRQVAVAAIRLTAVAGFVRFALPFFAALGEFMTSGWTFPTDVNTEAAVGTLLVAVLIWAAAPALARGIIGDGDLPGALALDVGKIALLGFALVGLVIAADGLVTLGQTIVEAYSAAFEPTVGVAPPMHPEAGAIVGAAIQIVIGAVVFLGRQGLARLVALTRDF